MKNLEDIYNSEFYCDDLNTTVTVKGYLKALLSKLWEEGEGFSGKRPFGNSGWERDLAVPLIQSGYLKGSVDFDEDGYLEDLKFNRNDYDHLVCQLIQEL